MKTISLSPAQLDLYIRDRLLPKLSLDGAPYQFELTGRGQRSSIIYLSVEGFKPLVLKGTSKKRKAEQMAEGCSHLRNHGINAPEVIYLDLHRKVFTQCGCYFVCEERIEGKVFEELDNPVEFLPLVACAFAQLHQVKRPTWGKIKRGRRYRFWGYLETTIKERLHTLRVHSDLCSKEQCDYYGQWFHRYKDTISKCKRFSLSHCDPHMHNLLISNTQEVYFLDNVSLRYLPLGIDYYKLQYHFCQFDVHKIERLHTSYLSSLTDEEKREFEESKDFFHCYVLLDFAQREAYSPSPHPYPLSLKRAVELMEGITKG